MGTWLSRATTLAVILVPLTIAATQASINYSQMPPHAGIYVDSFGVYASPPCVREGQTERSYRIMFGKVSDAEPVWQLASDVRQGTFAEVFERFGSHARPDEICRKSGGFVQRSTVWEALRGPASRWEDDGTWRW